MRKALCYTLAMAAGLAVAGCAGAAPAAVSTAADVRSGPAVPSQQQRQQSVPPPGAISRFRWSVLARSPLGARSSEVLAMDGGTLLELSGLAGATTTAGKVSADAAAFDTASGRWHRIASIPGIAARSPDSWNPVSVWAGRDLLFANGLLRSCARGCWTGVALYDPAANRWSQLTPPKQLDGLTIDAAAWTGRDIVLAAVDGTHQRLGVAAYDLATRHWQMITPALSRNHPPRFAQMVAADGRIILWSLWDRVTPIKNGFSEQAGIDVLAMRTLGTWRDVTGSWPQAQVVTSPVFTGTAILVSPGQIWCGDCIPPYTFNPGYFANPATLARTIIPLGPLGHVNPAFVWTGDAIIAVNLSSEVSGPGVSIQPDDMALWDPATRHWTKLQPPPGRPAMSVTPVWAGTGLLALGDNGKLLAFRH